MAATVTWEQILDGMITNVKGSLAIPDAGATSSSKYLRSVGRYLGQFESDEAMSVAPLMGRTPAVLVDFVGERVISTSIGRRVDLVEGTFVAICCSDSHRSREDRDAVYQSLRDVRAVLLGKRLPGLSVERFKFVSIVLVAQRPQLFAWGVRISARYHVDYTDGTNAVALVEVEADLTNAHVTPNPPTVVQLDVETT